MSALREWCDKKSWPKQLAETMRPAVHPETGEAFTRCEDFRIERQSQVVSANPPSAPSREIVTEWNEDDEPVAWRTLNDDEWAAAKADYANARDKWNRTAGLHNTKGPTLIHGTFETANGARASGTWAGSEWLWHESSGVTRSSSPSPQSTR